MNSVAKNFISLAIIQALNYVLPLATLPYLVRVLGVSNFGILVYSTALCGYFSVVVEYGFNLTATREVSLCRDDKSAISLLFSEVLTAKALLFVLSCIVFSIYAIFAHIVGDHLCVYIATFATIFAQGLMPTWLFQGMERMKWLTYVNIIAKVGGVIPIFFFVRKSDDYAIVPEFGAISCFVASMISLFMANRQFSVCYVKVSYSQVFNKLRCGWYVFLSQLSITLFSNTNVVVLGWFHGNSAVGVYSSVEKVMRAFAYLQAPLTGALFPYMASKIRSAPKSAFSIIKRVTLIGVCAYVVVGLCLIVFRHELLWVLYGTVPAHAESLLSLMAFVPLFIFINNIYGTQILLNMGKDAVFFRVLLISGAANLIFILPLTKYQGALGAAMAMLIVEALLAIMMYAVANKELSKG